MFKRTASIRASPTHPQPGIQGLPVHSIPRITIAPAHVTPSYRTSGLFTKEHVPEAKCFAQSLKPVYYVLPRPAPVPANDVATGLHPSSGPRSSPLIKLAIDAVCRWPLVDALGNPFFVADAGGGGPLCTESGNMVLPGTGERYVMSTSSSSELVSLTASNSRAESMTPPRLSYPLRVKRGSSKSYRSYLFLVRPEVEEVRPGGGVSAADPLNSSGRYRWKNAVARHAPPTTSMR